MASSISLQSLSNTLGVCSIKKGMTSTPVVVVSMPALLSEVIEYTSHNDSNNSISNHCGDMKRNIIDCLNRSYRGGHFIFQVGSNFILSGNLDLPDT